MILTVIQWIIHLQKMQKLLGLVKMCCVTPIAVTKIRKRHFFQINIYIWRCFYNYTFISFKNNIYSMIHEIIESFSRSTHISESSNDIRKLKNFLLKIVYSFLIYILHREYKFLSLATTEMILATTHLLLAIAWLSEATTALRKLLEI